MHARDVVQIQIGEDVFEFRDDLEIAGGIGQIERVAAMAGAFGDAHAGGAHGAERFIGGMHQQGMGVDDAFGFEFHQVGLEHHVAPAHVQPVFGQHAAHGVVEALVVGRRAHDGNLRRGGASGLRRAARQPAAPPAAPSGASFAPA